MRRFIECRNEIKHLYKVRENKYRVKRWDREEESFYVEVLQHTIMSLLNTWTKQHPLTKIDRIYDKKFCSM